MGAYLYYKLVNPTEAKEAMDFLSEKSETNKSLMEIHNAIHIYEPADIEYAKKNYPHMVDSYIKMQGTGDIKVSGGLTEEAEKKGYTEENVLEIQTQAFEELNSQFKMKYYARSCAFTKDEFYFNIEQMKRITEHGKHLSGRETDEYKELYSLLSKTKYDYKEDDEVLIDGRWIKIESDIMGRYLIQKDPNQPWKRTHIDKIEHLIEDYRKYTPSMSFGGAKVDIESWVKNNDNKLIYAEMVGNESYLKSITSVIMQGRMSMNNHFLTGSNLDYFTVLRSRNKRRMISLGDNLAHAIVYNYDQVINGNTIIAKTKDELDDAFLQWMDNNQPMPFPRDLISNIYRKLGGCNYIDELSSYGVVAISISKEIEKDDYAILQDVILDVVVENGLAKKTYLPKSPLLTEEQVANIYNVLASMPKTYELDGEEIKPVGLKLFTPSFTFYIVEADKGSPDDAFANMQKQAFGYIVNESDRSCSEWGYINVDELIELGAEMDLYFEDKFITSNGDIVDSKKVCDETVACA